MSHKPDKVHRYFFIDSHVFPGKSGGPVFGFLPRWISRGGGRGEEPLRDSAL